MTSPHVGPPLPSIVITEIDGDVAAYDPRGERVVVLNETASAIWRLSDGSRTLGELVELLAATYGLEPDVISEDVAEVVGRLTGEGFLSHGLTAEDRPPDPSDEPKG